MGREKNNLRKNSVVNEGQETWIQSLLDNWNIEYSNISVKHSEFSGEQEMEPHIWQIDNSYFLKRVEYAELVENIHTISLILHKHGIPTAVPISTKKEICLLHEIKSLFSDA